MTSLIKRRRRIRTLILCLVVAATLSLGAIPTVAQQPTQPSSPVNIKPEANEAPEIHSWTIEQLLPLTVSQAWQMSGKSEDKFFDMVQDLAAFCAQKRNLVLPASEAAGQQAGEYIKQQAKLDREQLLYAVVDQAVRKVGTPAPAQVSETLAK
ncbi:MAG TPA: hypothetical protein VNX88_04845 [Terriglobales bacterium]|jgi:hypothetical protein|nr:hypothetical protein [Terriglobales bacterium]